MNDRAFAVLEKYDIEVLRSWKGRGAVLCETKTGIKILKEYKGSKEHLQTQQLLLEKIKENGYTNVEEVIPTKEGDLLAADDDMNVYCLKTYRDGRECNIREGNDSVRVAEQMALLHRAMEMPELVQERKLSLSVLPEEFEKRSRELRRIRKYIRSKRQKNGFEYFLFQNFDPFLERAERITEEAKQYPEIFTDKGMREKGSICHGDLQHHNALLLNHNEVYFINFEKYIWDNPMRDFSLFFRKMMEKNNWRQDLGQYILGAYQKQKPLSEEDRIQLYFRLSFPEKFWKIVNFYYNTSKVWMPGKNMEKLEKLLQQEEEKNMFLEANIQVGGLHK